MNSELPESLLERSLFISGGRSEGEKILPLAPPTGNEETYAWLAETSLIPQVCRGSGTLELILSDSGAFLTREV